MKKTKSPSRKIILQGKVASAKMDKTIIVRLDRIKKHPIYLKSYNITKKFYAHDEKNEAKKGDIVLIEAAKPKSRLKRWQLVKIISKKNPDIEKNEAPPNSAEYNKTKKKINKVKK
jgi:small subunit ribosomal protein S17